MDLWAPFISEGPGILLFLGVREVRSFLGFKVKGGFVLVGGCPNLLRED